MSEGGSEMVQPVGMIAAVEVARADVDQADEFTVLATVELPRLPDEARPLVLRPGETVDRATLAAHLQTDDDIAELVRWQTLAAGLVALPAERDANRPAAMVAVDPVDAELAALRDRYARDELSLDEFQQLAGEAVSRDTATAGDAA